VWAAHDSELAYVDSSENDYDQPEIGTAVERLFTRTASASNDYGHICVLALQ